jgi:hypothetical protein
LMLSVFLTVCAQVWALMSGGGSGRDVFTVSTTAAWQAGAVARAQELMC